jgi:hypothetical protein
MHLIFCLASILTDFRPLFNRQNFSLFCTFIVGFITAPRSGTLTEIYQAVHPQTGYHSLVKFLSRGKWDADAVANHLIKLLQGCFDNWVYVYDETQAIKTGHKQFGLHFFRNHRYQKRNSNQSKFHSGHQFGALGLLCSTVTETILFPVWVNLICPKTKQNSSNAVLKRICTHIPRGLIIFDRGFNRRKVFACVLQAGHHLLCRAKSNAVFYRLADGAKGSKRGRPKKYGKRLHLPYLRYATIDIDNKRYAIASVEALTKMCPQPVRLVVIRTRPKKAKPFRYFCVYTTDLTLDLPQIVRYYQKRWTIETAFRDAKQHFGFDTYRVKSKKSISRWVQLSFVAVCLTQLVFTLMANTSQPITVERVCQQLGIDWYRPKKLTRGLMVRYLRALMSRRLFSATTSQKSKSHNMQQTFDTDA